MPNFCSPLFVDKAQYLGLEFFLSPLLIPNKKTDFLRVKLLIQLWVVLVGKDMMFIALRRLFQEKGNIIKGGRGPLCSIPIFWTSLKSC